MQDLPPFPLRACPSDAKTLIAADSTMYAVANADLSQVHQSERPPLPTKIPIPAVDARNPPSQQHLEHMRAASLSESLDASMYALANLDLSLGHPSESRPASKLIDAETLSKRRIRIARARAYKQLHHSRRTSGFTVSSFGSQRMSGEVDPFHYHDVNMDEDACMPLPQMPIDPSRHGLNQSTSSIASISSYGVLLHSGVRNPFGYDRSSVGTTGQPQDVQTEGLRPKYDRSRRQTKRFSVDSDRSSFYFNSSHPPVTRRHRDSIISFTSASGAPTVGFMNRTRQRLDSIDSESELANAYGNYGAHAGRMAYAEKEDGPSRDSIISEVSVGRLGRPGLGDKMFESHHDDTVPLSDISASPYGSEVGRGDESLAERPSMDSMVSGYDDHRSSVDSIFDRNNSRPSSVSSGSVFGNDELSVPARGALFPQYGTKKLRPLSMLSFMSTNTSIQEEDDTMISMLGGEKVRVPRGALGTSLNSSPCANAEKKRKRMYGVRMPYRDEDMDTSPNKARLVGRESVMSVKFARRSTTMTDLIEQSENSFTSADGEDLTSQERADIFTRPVSGISSRPISGISLRPISGISTRRLSGISTRPLSTLSTQDVNESLYANSRSASPLFFNSAPPDTPPLSCCSSTGSQSSIDMDQLRVLLEQPTPPVSSKSRARARGQGHRRPVSQISRNSVIETIVEEAPGQSPTSGFRFNPNFTTSFLNDSGSEIVDLEDEVHVEVLRKYYAFTTEARNTVERSKVVWSDTEFSRFALSCM